MEYSWLYNLCLPVFGYLTISGAPYLLITQKYKSKFKFVNSLNFQYAILLLRRNKLNFYFYLNILLNFFLFRVTINIHT